MKLYALSRAGGHTSLASFRIEDGGVTWYLVLILTSGIDGSSDGSQKSECLTLLPYATGHRMSGRQAIRSSEGGDSAILAAQQAYRVRQRAFTVSRRDLRRRRGFSHFVALAGRQQQVRFDSVLLGVEVVIAPAGSVE
jgi:hypothetical protein